MFLDKSLVEVYINGEQCAVMLGYYSREDATGVSLRLDVVDSSGDNTGLIELAAYGTPVAE